MYPSLAGATSTYETALSHGIINGYAEHTFRPSGLITRGQLAKMLVLAKGWDLLNPTQPHFTDVPRDAPFYTYIETALSAQLALRLCRWNLPPQRRGNKGAAKQDDLPGQPIDRCHDNKSPNIDFSWGFCLCHAAYSLGFQPLQVSIRNDVRRPVLAKT